MTDNDAPLFTLAEEPMGAFSVQQQQQHGLHQPSTNTNNLLTPGGSSARGAAGGTNSGSSQSHHLLSGGSASGSPMGAQAMENGTAGSSGSLQHQIALSSPDAQNRNVYVASLPSTFSDDDLRGLFTPYGPIQSCKMFNNDGKASSQGRAYGFVMYAEEASVQRAIDALVGAVVGTQRIQVRRAKMSGRVPSQPASATASPSSSAVNQSQMLSASAVVPQQQQPPPQHLTPVAPSSISFSILSSLPTHVGGTLSLQHIGMLPSGQPVYATPTGQQVLLAIPVASAPAPPPPPPPQQQQQYVMLAPSPQPAPTFQPQQQPTTSVFGQPSGQQQQQPMYFGH